MTARERVKIILVKENMTITALAEKMTIYTGKNYSRQNLSGKLSKGLLKYSEFEAITKILGYKLEFVEVESAY